MTAWTLAEVESQLTEWKAALTAVSRNQSYSIEGRAMTRAQLPEIRKTIDWLERKHGELSSAASGAGKVRYVSG